MLWLDEHPRTAMVLRCMAKSLPALAALLVHVAVAITAGAALGVIGGALWMAAIGVETPDDQILDVWAQAIKALVLLGAVAGLAFGIRRLQPRGGDPRSRSQIAREMIARAFVAEALGDRVMGLRLDLFGRWDIRLQRPVPAGDHRRRIDGLIVALTIELADIPGLDEGPADLAGDRMKTITALADRIIILDTVGSRPQGLESGEVIAAAARRAREILGRISQGMVLAAERDLLVSGSMREHRFAHWVRRARRWIDVSPGESVGSAFATRVMRG